MDILRKSIAACLSVVIVFVFFSLSGAYPANSQPDAEPEKPAIAPLPIKLPPAGYRDTPPNLAGIPNLEKPSGKPRPPFYAPKTARNVALAKPVTSSDDMPIYGELSLITDGDKLAQDGSFVELGPFLQHVTIDLETPCEIYAIIVWHWHIRARVYYQVVVQLADDADFTMNVRTVFNNDVDNSTGLGVGRDKRYVESHEGKLIDAKGHTARYVRLYSNGNSESDLNEYTEVEVWGRPCE